MLQKADIISKVSEVAKKYNASHAYLFGSYARNTANDNSDLDILIEGGKSFYPADIFSITEELNDHFGLRVDVYELSEINKNSKFLDSINSDKVMLV